MYSEDDLIPISAVSHVTYCERRYALVHLEQLWEENLFTAEGQVLHERVDVEHHESRRLFRQEYGMAVRSLEYGLTGKCDLVEIWFDEVGAVRKVSPVEFKRGRKKESDVDRAQLCAQALCLEEMFGVPVESGQLYYLQEHRRRDVTLDCTLREKTDALIGRIRELRESGRTPSARYEKKKCDSCSLYDLCMPQNAGSGGKKVSRYISAQLRYVDRLCEEPEEPANEIDDEYGSEE
ncbi:CRISPR-associated protein Cas4 [Brucepastera parasyntrophica]|uniref:CRISPR-associated protein Cas4 n=1 Tax=Brucepastera parasyntrophica TaxID=2880008 RepID=UPI00210B7F4B|nr:CRISPR-associated protein Cas4 [Brucepastera parasyntrophica]ULQ60107.1 CRISPR-associated protein Cas4 [Brucepastera parasyntrophica]